MEENRENENILVYMKRKTQEETNKNIWYENDMEAFRGGKYLVELI